MKYRFLWVISGLLVTGLTYALAADKDEAATKGAYGVYGSPAAPETAKAVGVGATKTMPARYVRIENRGDVEFSELEAYDASKTNVALKKPVTVSNSAWGDGALGNDGVNSKDNHVMMRTPTGNWWEVDLGQEIPLTHVLLHMRPAAYCEGYRPLNGATFSILDGSRQTVATCQLEAKQSEDTLTIPMDPVFFHQRDLATRFSVQSAAPGNIFTQAKGKLHLVVPEPETLASGNLSLADLDGRVLRKVTLSRGKDDYAISLPGKGYYTITATATYDGGLNLTKTASAAVVGKPIDRQTRLNSIFGIQGDGQAFIDLGTAWCWTGMMTHHVFKSGAGFEWAPTYADRIKNGKLDVSPEANNFILLNWMPEFLQSVPPAQRGNSPTSPPNDEAEFVRYIQWLVAFIPDFVHYFGPIAEPSWSFKGSPEELAHYHEIIAKTVREMRPDIHVIGPMMSPGNSTALESIQVLDKLGMFAHLDGISINPYVVNWPTPFRSRMPEADIIEFVDAVINHFATAGRPGYPVYVTEFGWYSPDHVDELTKARYSSRAALLFATRPTVKMANFFALSGGGGFSYLNSDGTPRPVYPAMAHTLRWLAGCEDGKIIKLTPTLYLATFRQGRKAKVAVWDTEKETPVRLPAKSIKRIEDMTGRTMTIKGDVITASQNPIFIDLADATLPALISPQTAAKETP